MLFCGLRWDPYWHQPFSSVQERVIPWFIIIFIDKVKNLGRNCLDACLHMPYKTPSPLMSCPLHSCGRNSLTPFGSPDQSSFMKELKVIHFLCFILGECSGLHTREWILMSDEVRLWPHGKGIGSQSQSIRESIILEEGGRRRPISCWKTVVGTKYSRQTQNVLYWKFLTRWRNLSDYFRLIAFLKKLTWF